MRKYIYIFARRKCFYNVKAQRGLRGLPLTSRTVVQAEKTCFLQFVRTQCNACYSQSSETGSFRFCVVFYDNSILAAVVFLWLMLRFSMQFRRYIYNLH